jgi:uncharacterized protein (DUF488 family)
VALTVHTIGHSTRTLGELAGLLRAHGVTMLADVRALPGSRRMPHFDREALERALPEHGIGYRHLRELGGLRRPARDSPNLAWRSQSFRGYADHMQTEAWSRALTELMRLARDQQMAIMCAEAVPWRCHRSLIADGLTARGVDVRHITGPASPAPHALTSFALVEGDRITYPGTSRLGFDV